ncbi:hypothetical protein CTTA_5193 [Comamonas testosteroni]|uniref:Uncharacterized protein n=1 Tax=Comamonas testosteroni TaxID=285 RepID=A0A5A7MK23_COMTE|nr:hypothetical protein [Comamonas testosteroni]GEQ78188.1 hypothetical protein CTTA_5193 [Comamonas testosteroni]
MSRPVTLSGALLRPLLQRQDFSNGVSKAFPQSVLLVKPLLAAAVGLGNGFIASTVEKQEQADPAPLPLARRVVLLLEPTLQLVAETVSDAATGAYRFDGLNPNARFTVISLDHLHMFRAVLADNLAPSV